MQIRIGCGSWMDDEYVGALYPEESSAKDRLKLYATRLNHVEVNFTTYRTPSAKMTENWVQQTPDGFTFGIKLHRDFSRTPHKTATETTRLDALLRGVEPLIANNRLGAFLLLLDQTFGPKRNRLEELDPVVSKLQPYVLAVELRNRGWIDGGAQETTLGYFRERGIAWVTVDMPRVEKASIMPPVDEVTHPKLAYLRLHGRNVDWQNAKSTADRHNYLYPEDELDEIVERVRSLAARAETVHLIANNHAQDFAPKTALALMQKLGVGPRATSV